MRAAERAYVRGDALVKRANLMAAWAAYVDATPATVLTFPAVAASA